MFDGFLELDLGTGLAIGGAGIEEVDPVERTGDKGSEETNPVLHEGRSIGETYEGHDEPQQTQHHPDKDNNHCKGGGIVFLFFDQHKLFVLSVHFFI